MTADPGFSTRDPTQPAFWDERFRAGFTPWDAGCAPPAFLRWLDALGPGRGRRVLVPGCGRGYEVAALDAAGFEVTAIDYAADAVAQARASLGEALAARTLHQADFFADGPWCAQPFDLIYERAFLAALPPARWAEWAQRAAQRVAPGGSMAGLFVLDADAAAAPVRRGPPFATSLDELQRLLHGTFTLVETLAVPHTESLPVFAGREMWCDWQRAR